MIGPVKFVGKNLLSQKIQILRPSFVGRAGLMGRGRLTGSTLWNGTKRATIPVLENPAGSAKYA